MINWKMLIDFISVVALTLSCLEVSTSNMILFMILKSVNQIAFVIRLLILFYFEDALRF